MPAGQSVSPFVWLVLAVVILLPIAVSLWPESTDNTQPPVEAQPLAPPSVPPPAEPEVAIEPEASAEPEVEPPQEVAGITSEIGDADWLEAHGYFTAEEQALYDSYSDEAVRQLTAGGDLLAGAVLIKRYSDAGNYPAARLAATVAAAHGSTAALIEIANLHEIQANSLAKEKQGLRRKELQLAMAALEVALSRGDPSAYFHGMKLIHAENLDITGRLQLDISDEADRMYYRLSVERSALGLPPFNDPDVEAMARMTTLDESMPWGQRFFELPPDDAGN